MAPGAEIVGLMGSENAAADKTEVLRRSLRGLSRRDRAILRLRFERAASTRELATLLGINRSRLRRWLRRARDRAADPARIAFVRHWRTLSDHELRLAFYHLVRGMSLRRIARQGLVGEPGAHARGASPASLSRRMRRIRRKLERAESRTRARRGATDAK